MLSPTTLYRTLKRSLGGKNSDHGRAGEKGADFYEESFHKGKHWRVHYTASPYYFIWTVILDRIRRAHARNVLEVGCGSGQLAHALHEAGIIARYCGFDFSEARITQARQNCPTLDFQVADAFQTGLFTTFDYDLVLATEFLEHVEGDLQILHALRAGTRFIGTVPNFPYASHVRHFQDCDEVAQRYAPLFTDFTVHALYANERGKTFFLLEGVRSGS